METMESPESENLSAFGVVLTYKRELYDDLRSVFTIVRNESV